MSVAGFAASLTGGLLLGFGAATIAGVYARRGFGPEVWGLPAGPVVGLMAFCVLLAMFSRVRALRRAGAAVVCVVLGLAALAVFWWIAVYRVSPWPGTWIWIIAIGLATGSLWALRWAFRT